MEQVNERNLEKVYQGSGGGKLKYKPKKCIPKSFLPTASQGAKPYSEKLEVGGQVSRFSARSKSPDECGSHGDEGSDPEGWSSWIGKWVNIGGVKQGILRYYGPTQFSDGYWCGVELSEAVGKNNGTVGGIQYFSCRENFGIFAPVSKVQKLIATPDAVMMDIANEQTVIDSCHSQSKSNAGKKELLSQSSIPISSSKMCQSLSETKIAESKIPAPKFAIRSSRSMTIANEVPSSLGSSHLVLPPTSGKCERPRTVSESYMEIPKAKLKQINEVCHPAERNSFLLFNQSAPKHRHTDQVVPESTVMCATDSNSDVRTFHDMQEFTSAASKSILESPDLRGSKSNLNFDAMSAEKDSTFSIQLCEQSLARSPQILSPEGCNASADSGEGDVNRTFVCHDGGQLKRDSLALLEHILHAAASGKQEEYVDDDQQSLELDDSLGILTPSQMKDFTGCFDHPIANMEFEVASIPKTMSCDDVNEIPEFEEVQDITVEYLSDNSKQCYCFKNTDSKNLHTYLESFPSDVSKVLSHADSCDILASPVLDSQSDMDSEKLSPDVMKISEPPEMKNLCFSTTDDDDDEDMDDANAKGDVVESLHDKTKQAEGNRHAINNFFKLDKEFNLLKTNERLELLSEKTGMECHLPLAENEVPIRENFKGDNEEQVVKLFSDELAPPSQAGGDDTSSVMHQDYPLPETPPENLEHDLFSKTMASSSLDLQDNSASRTQLSESLVQSIGIDSQGDESELQRLVGSDDSMRTTDVIHEKERPISVYTVGSTDTGFQGDEEMDIQSEVESVAVGSAEVDPNRISTYSADSCIVSEGTGAYPKSDVASDWELDVEVCDGFTELDSSVGFSSIKHGRHVHRSTESVCSARPGDITPLSESCKPLEVTHEDIRRMEREKGISSDGTVLEEYPPPNERECKTSEGIELNENYDTLCEELRFVEKSIQVCDLDVKLPGIDKSAQTQDSCLSPEVKTPEKLHQLASKKLELKTSAKKTENEQPAKLNKIKKSDTEPTVTVSKKVPLPPPPKLPKKNVMSKIKAMIEATSCKSPGKVEETKPKVTRALKKSKWEAVTNKIAQSLAEEKVKPKTIKEIRSRVDTNLTGARQAGTGTRSASSRNNSVIDNEGSIVSGPITPTSKNIKNLLHSQREFADTVSGQVITDDLDPEQLTWDSSTKHESNSLQNENVVTREPKPHERHRSRSPRLGVTSRSGSPFAPTDASNISFASNASHASKTPKLPSKQHSGPTSQVETVKKAETPSAPTKKPVASRPANIQATTKRTTPYRTAEVNKRPPWGANASRQQPTPPHTITKRPVSGMTASKTSPSSACPSKATTPLIHSRSSGLITNNRDKPRSLALGKSNLETPDGKKGGIISPSKAEINRLNQEIQHLGALCETRTKELNLLKMQLKHTTLGFDAFTSLVKYLTEELDAFSNPHMIQELQKTREDLRETETKLKSCEEELEKIKEYHATEIIQLNEKLSLVREEEITQLHAKHATDLEELKALHEKELSEVKDLHEKALKETEEKHALEIETLNKEYTRMQEELNQEHAKQLEAANLCHEETKTSLNSQISNLRKQYEELQKQTKQFEEALQKDTNEKIQWISAKKADLQKEVDSLKTVLEMKRNEIHSLRTENAELKKELEELPLAREKIKMLKARAEDLQALVNQKVKVQRQLSSEHQHLKESYEKESRTNMRLSMEKEELEWKLRQNMEASILLTSIAGPELLEKLAKEHQLQMSPSNTSFKFPNADLSSFFGDAALNFGDASSFSEATSPSPLAKKSPLRSPVSLSASTPCSPQLKTARTHRKRTTSKSESTPPSSQSQQWEKNDTYYITQEILQTVVENAIQLATNNKMFKDKATGGKVNNGENVVVVMENNLDKKDSDSVEKLGFVPNLEREDAVTEKGDVAADDIDILVENESYQIAADNQDAVLEKLVDLINAGEVNDAREAGVCLLDAEEGSNDETGLVMEPVFKSDDDDADHRKSDDDKAEGVAAVGDNLEDNLAGSGAAKVLLPVSQASEAASSSSSASMQSSMTSSSDSSSWSAALPTSPHHMISCEASNASLSSTEDPSLCSSNGSSSRKRQSSGVVVLEDEDDEDQFFVSFRAECPTGASSPTTTDDGSQQRRLHFENITVCHYRVASPRSLAGEAMVQDPSTSPSFSQFTSEDSSGYRCERQAHTDIDDEFSEPPGSVHLGISEAPSTLPAVFDPPSLEASSQGIVLTDSTNIDGSWCEEELPSESEA